MPALYPRPNIDCLYTTIQNISGKEAIFSFIPPHGRTMAAGEMLTVAGNIIERLANKTSNRQFQALERALQGGFMAILATPAVFVYNGTIGQVIDGSTGTLGMVDPCWMASMATARE
jgi:hypothetical protein